MEEEKFYSVKDIILGIRGEYLTVDEYLYIMGCLCHNYDKNVSDLNFYLSRSSVEDRPEIICQFIHNLKTVRGMIIYIAKKLGISFNGMEKGYCVKDGNGNYLIKNNYYKTFIENKRIFSIYADYVLGSKFVNKVNFGLTHFNGDVFGCNMFICPNLIRFEMVGDGISLKCEYLPTEDVINIKTFGIEASEKIVKKVLDYQIPTSLLCEYHRELIDSSPIVRKQLEILSSVSGFNDIDLLIEEKRDRVVLRRMMALNRRKKINDC